MGFILNPYRYESGADFDPASLTGYQFHLIAGSLDGALNDGDTLTEWPDETTNYNYNSISNTPTLEKNEVNGESVVHFDANDRVRDLTNDMPATNKFTQVWVMKTPSTATQVYLHRSELADSYILKRADDDLVFYADNNVVGLTTGDFAPGVAAGNWWVIVWTVDFTTGSAAIYINNVTADSTPSSSSDSSNVPAQYFHIPTNTSYPSLDLAEVILYSGYILTSEEISSMLTYMGNKYNISVTT